MPGRSYRLIVFGLCLLLIVGATGLLLRRRQMMSQPTNPSFRLASQAFGDGKLIPQKYSCKGANVSPPLMISGMPSTTKSLALIMHDPDAPVGDFTHWLIWNIGTQITAIDENNVPTNAVEGLNNSNKIGYMGPCPPSGTHHYVFELYALDSPLTLMKGATREQLEAALQSHVVAHTTLTGLFSAQ